MTDNIDNPYGSLQYDFLHFIQTKKKDDFRKGGEGEKWAASIVNFMLGECQPLVKRENVENARLVELGKVIAKDYKRIIDPIDPKTGEGGTADYFYADWEANPIYLHLQRIIDAKLSQSTMRATIKATDELSKSKRQKENDRIIHRNWIREIINMMLSQAGFPTIGSDEDPNEFIEKMKSATDKNEQKSKKLFKSKNVNPKADDTILKDIVNAIETNEDLALYQEFIYRTDSEISVEIGAEHYMSINKWDIIKNEVIKNLRHHNAYVINFYTSETTGTPIIENVDLGDNAFMTMPFSREDAMDCTGFIHKQSITFGNFVRMFGASLTKEELVQIFDSTRGASQSYATSTPSQRETAKIRIGKCVWETQNIEVYKTGMNPDGNMIMVKKDDNYEPQKGNTKYQSDKKHFNVWYECFFIDYTGNSTQGSIDASRIFKYRKVQDQQRFGEDGRMSKSPYIIYSKNSIMPINEIITRFMKMINLIWFRVQNDIGNDNPHIQIYVAEALESIMNNIDTETSKHENSMGESIKMIKQTGKAIVNRFMKDNPNQIIDNPIKDVPSGYMNSAMEKLGVIGVLYELMLKSIGINDVSEGNSPKPRQALGGIEMATQASNNSRFYLEEAMMNCHVELLYRFLYYFHEIVNENDKERVAELESIVGEANSKALSGIKDIPLHSLGIHIDPTDIEELKRIVLEMAANEYKKGALPAQDYLFLISSTNIKKAIAILRLRLNQRERKLQEQQERQFQQQMQLQQSNLETQKQLMGVDGQIKAELEKVKGQVDERLLIVENKLQTQGSLEVSDKRKSNKLEEIQVQDQVDTKNKMIGVS